MTTNPLAARKPTSNGVTLEMMEERAATFNAMPWARDKGRTYYVRQDPETGRFDLPYHQGEVPKAADPQTDGLERFGFRPEGKTVISQARIDALPEFVKRIAWCRCLLTTDYAGNYWLAGTKKSAQPVSSTQHTGGLT